MDFSWKPEYENLASEFLKQHFGGAQGLTNCFPCMRGDYPWGAHRPDVLDSRVPAKNNTEYHGLEKHAIQYQATAQYEYAFHHWLIAASWRRQDMVANNFNDDRHEKALEYCIKQALYNRALHRWQKNSEGCLLPDAFSFGLDDGDVRKKEEKALEDIEEFGKISKT
ncbi:hypothetical protein DYI22_05400 [Marinobacter lipolyticus]|uniref:hypothetical protein n=1 Tax=Marinobacter lipolyticus TaxID=209639 RepID=UPI001BCD4211|nr:hypothetical protein [Marinobacter lipolyticus]MBS8239936.1 hypothetical protein [Marinobacter lipolyticus]